ncbi:UDP-glycosyltransferase 78D4 [Citrus sinensis]|uniref:UDP-glycosyltransferase 78D4 n=1 Tax=Citrus sinensis TaxID=2711 RepID=A0ACB8IKS9_CITSI|nr:UDP-glycosyltransferase 78D4 [Citrus sinensis]
MLSKLGGVLPQASAAVMNFYQELYCSSQLTNDLNSKVPSLLKVGFLTQPLPPPPLPPSDSDETGYLQWPFYGDHRMNARMVEEVWGIGVKVEGILLTKSGVLQSLDLMFSHEGKKMRENVRHLKEIVIEAAGPKP